MKGLPKIITSVLLSTSLAKKLVVISYGPFQSLIPALLNVEN
jgi:hypothetical protein